MTARVDVLAEWVPPGADVTAIGQGLLTQLVARRCGVDPADVRLLRHCAVCGGPHGRPVAQLPGARPAPGLSVAHAGSWVLAAAADGAVGIDVEPVDTVGLSDVDAMALTPAERAALAALPPGEQDRARLHAWVRKEALLKRAGLGLTLDPSSIQLGLDPHDAVLSDVVLPGSARGAVALTRVDLDPAHVAWVAAAPGPVTLRVERDVRPRAGVDSPATAGRAAPAR